MLESDDLKILVKTLPGLETILARELKELGARQVKPLKRAVQVRGDLGFVYKCNIWLRTALRVLVQLDTSTVHNETDLYRVVKRLPCILLISSIAYTSPRNPRTPSLIGLEIRRARGQMWTYANPTFA